MLESMRAVTAKTVGESQVLITTTSTIEQRIGQLVSNTEDQGRRFQETLSQLHQWSQNAHNVAEATPSSATRGAGAIAIAQTIALRCRANSRRRPGSSPPD